MSWRNHETHKKETKAVKAALNAAGINCTVGHGTGTAWGWLHIHIGKGADRDLHDKTLKIAQAVTGRHGDYDGEINIFQEDQWNDKAGKTIPINQPFQIKPKNLGGTMEKTTFNLEKATTEFFELETVAKRHYQSGDECLIKAGQILNNAKAALQHGEFTDWRRNILKKSDRYCENLQAFAVKFANVKQFDAALGYSRMSLIAQMDIEPEIIEKVIETVSETKATKKETGELKKQIDAEIQAGRLVRAEDIEPLLTKARETARNNEKAAAKDRIDPAIEKVVTERNQMETAYNEALAQIEALDAEINTLKSKKPETGSNEKELKKQLSDREAELSQVREQLKTVTGNLKKFEESIQTQATAKIEEERAKVREQVEKQYSQKLASSEETAEKRLNEMVELQTQLSDLKQSANEIKRLKSENIGLKTALEEKSKLVQENQMLTDRIHSLESILKSVKKTTPKEKLLEVIQQVETMLHASA